MLNRFKTALVLSLVVVTLVSCGGDTSEKPKSESPKTVEFNLTGGDQMKYNLKAMVAKEGDLIRVNFQNIGKMPKEAMGHNFVLLKPGVDVAFFATRAIASKHDDYIPADELDKIIVHSKLLGPGETDVIEFTAPAKGTYKFICSFPGHYMSMQGNLIVR